jgi:hypothetical protein
MPIIRSTKDGKPCFKVKNVDTCYPFTKGNKASEARARAKAQKQLAAVEASKNKRGKK